MSKAQRLARLRKNLASKITDFDQWDRDFAFAIFVIEKEFNVGPITRDFPILKLWNLLDEYNIEQYKKITKKGEKGIGTFK